MGGPPLEVVIDPEASRALLVSPARSVELRGGTRRPSFAVARVGLPAVVVCALGPLPAASSLAEGGAAPTNLVVIASCQITDTLSDGTPSGVREGDTVCVLSPAVEPTAPAESAPNPTKQADDPAGQEAAPPAVGEPTPAAPAGTETVPASPGAAQQPTQTTSGIQAVPSAIHVAPPPRAPAGPTQPAVVRDREAHADGGTKRRGAAARHPSGDLMTFTGADNTVSMADHADHIHVGFAPLRPLRR